MTRKRDSLKLLKKLERIFPEDNIITSKAIFGLEGNLKIISLLEQKKLIEKSEYKIIGLPNQETSKVVGYSITHLGIELLNGLRQKRTNFLLISLTIILLIIGALQIFILYSK